MAGAPYHERVNEYIKNSSVAIPKRSKFINDATATKTAFKQNLIFKDFEFKKENLMEILEQ